MFRALSHDILVAPQISLDDVAEAARQGVKLIISNRPERESDDQPPGSAIEAAARKAGLAYVAIPVTHSGFSEPQVLAMAKALERPMAWYWPIAGRAHGRHCYGGWPRRHRAETPMP